MSIELIGWAADLFFLLAFFLVSRGKLSGKGGVFNSMNLAGAILYGSYATQRGTYPVFVLEFFWGCIAVSALWKLRNKNKTGESWKQDSTGLYHFVVGERFKHKWSFSEAVNLALSTLPDGPAWFWYFGVPYPLNKGDTAQTLVARWWYHIYYPEPRDVVEVTFPAPIAKEWQELGKWASK
jgi:hypothetical protein